MGWKTLGDPHLKPESVTSALPQNPKVDKEADKLLKKMSDYLTGLQQFSYKSTGMYETVDSKNKKQKTAYTSVVSVKRPNKLRADVTGDKKDGTVYYDGSQFSVMGKNVNMYAQTSAPATLDQALDLASNKLQLDPPGADLIYTNPYNGLIEDVTLGQLLEDAVINGKTCSHLSFKGKEVDWEIWIEKGASPLPRKYLIISKNMPERPEFSVEFTDWKLNANTAFNDQFFAFTPPTGSRKIEFMQAKEMRDANNPKK
jgi:hypothetical protein